MHAWLPEEDIPASYAARKGWNGTLAIPRDVFLSSIPRVVRALRSPLEDISSVDCVTEKYGSTTLYALGIRPIREISTFR